MNHVYSEPRAYLVQRPQEHLVLSWNPPLSSKVLFVCLGRNEFWNKVPAYSTGILGGPQVEPKFQLRNC